MSQDTIVLDRDYRYRMLGAQNLNGITCFLNATLFAMFCRSDSCFDALLYSAFEGPVGRFATMVRLWVNMVHPRNTTVHLSYERAGLSRRMSLRFLLIPIFLILATS
jgi:hypothetical protein